MLAQHAYLATGDSRSSVAESVPIVQDKLLGVHKMLAQCLSLSVPRHLRPISSLTRASPWQDLNLTKMDIANSNIMVSSMWFVAGSL